MQLFEHFDTKAQTLYDTLRLAGYENEIIVIEDDGFLPEHFVTPYRYFANYQVPEDACPLYFNQVDIPRYWEIIGSNDEAKVNDMGQVRANIFYHHESKPRIVSHVEWLDSQGRLQYVDHYTQHGVYFAQTVYNLAGEKILRRYLDQQGREVIYENFVAQSIIVNWQGKAHHFNDKVQYVQFFLQALNKNMERFVINSLGLPFLVLYHLDKPGSDLIFWQEQSGGHVPGNMSLILQGDHLRNYHVIVPDKEEYECLKQQLGANEQQRLLPAGYLYDYARQNTYTANIVTMTNSDQIHHLEAIVKACPKATFHIGAVTEMSDKLTAFDDYPNVKLFPTIERATVNKLYQSCDIYLDINEGGEIINAVQTAFDHDLLILGYRDTAHNAAVTAPENLFEKGENAAQLIQVLKDIQLKKRYFQVRHNYQKSHVHEITRKAFNQVMTRVTK
ncbi:accessory Sec system glycosylation chaperone GtfB [Staphylococcus americanisciuri]|uniref:UDP-N-acetylglucosamine--peptide N-acetylglucosaminyltransferase stabilizing protein GtfB n=1 Tax=Staphylococcus americanisciuri TaxID=2973940 RepID=A0ABT2F4I9_9STAP|nr:accessory Sec system glycosylation chaperone GtfB [Staphylococcus americanisciuri]MCS4487337.1 accessory Sec system glycosylation chaperone GtfB [Staphylococcus americanisciuri]